jgi:hypothetical protein
LLLLLINYAAEMNFELILTSPLTRALQTTSIVFKTLLPKVGIHIFFFFSPFFFAISFHQNKGSQFGPSWPQRVCHWSTSLFLFLLFPLFATQPLSTGSDDLGRPPEDLEKEFPHFDFRGLERIWWYTGRTESGQDEDPNLCKERFKKSPFVEPRDLCERRADIWKQWLASRKELSE